MVNIPLSALIYVITIVVSESVFFFKMSRRNYFWLRLLAFVVAYPLLCYSFGYVAEAFEKVNKIEILKYLFTIAFFAIIFFLSVPAVMVCWNVKLRDAVCFCIAGYSLEHISQVIVGIFSFILSKSGVTVPHQVRTYVFNIGIKWLIILGIFFFFIKPLLDKNKRLTSDKRILAIAFLNLCICMVLNIFKGYGMGAATNSFTNSVICALYAFFGCLLCLCLQLGYFKENNLKEDVQTLEQLLRQESKKHELSKETVDLINLKFHDLKYQLKKLEKSSDTEQQEIIQEIYKLYDVYDSFVTTGSEVLDIIIMNFYPVCLKHSIQFTYIIDGAALKDFRSTDVLSLFGNLLDNAMECVVNEEVEKRIIKLNVRKEKQMLFIHIHNFCTQEPKFEDGLPLTVKSDKRYHGFGVRSVKYLVEKYGGDLRMSWADNIFSVDLIIQEK